MTDYENGKNVLLRRPEPGRPVHSEKPKVVQPIVDVNAIANAVIDAINRKLPNIVVRDSKEVKPVEVFDESSSMQKLAEAMTVQRGSSESNFEDLGNEKKTVKDKKEVDKTIDLLSNMGD